MNPPPDAGNWTVETLREALLELIDANDKRYEQRFIDSQTAVGAALSAAKTAVDAALSAAKEAVTKAEVAVEKRLEGVNEFRGQLADQQRTLMPRPEAELVARALADRLDKLEKASYERGGKTAGFQQSWGLIVGVIVATGAIVALIMRFIPDKP